VIKQKKKKSKSIFDFTLARPPCLAGSFQEKEEETENEGYIRKERTFIRHYREIPFPDGATEDGATSQLKNGV